MKFAELKALFAGWRVRVIAINAEGGNSVEEISLLETVNAYDKLAKYDDAELLRIDTGTMDQDGEKYPALEVTVRV